MNHWAEDMPADLGALAIQRDGGSNRMTGELWPGFPISADDIVLDAGCGYGNETTFCAERGARVIFSDIDPAMVAHTRMRVESTPASDMTPIVSDTNPLPLPNEVATKIIAAEVLEHVDDPGQFLQELVRVGKPGALYLLAVPDPVAETILQELAPEVYRQKPNHIRIIGRDELEKMATDAGLVVERHSYYGFYFSIWWFFFWISNATLENPNDILLKSWSGTWKVLLDMPNGDPVRQALNELMPKSQYLIARKPEALSLRSTLRRLTNSSFIRRATQMIAAKPILPERPEPAQPNESIDVEFVGLHDAVRSGWFDGDRHELFKGFQISPDDTVLDAGCGDGGIAQHCGRLGAHVVFSDLDAKRVALTEEKLRETSARGITPIVGDGHALPLEDGSITRVISTEVIEHVDDPRRFLKELARVGKSGALYLLAVPDPVQEALQRRLAPPEFFRKGQGTIRGLSSGHLRTVGREEFEALVTEAGLEVQSHHYVSFYWALWFVFFWICNVDFSKPEHPLLMRWTRTWKVVLDRPGGQRVKAHLDAFMPKSQIIVARKP